MSPSLSSSKPVVRAQTLCHRSIVVPLTPDLSVGELKSIVCRGRDLHPEELQMISHGKELLDTDIASPECFVLIRNSATRSIEVTIKVTGDKDKRSISLSLPLKMRVNKLKSLLLKDKHTKWSTTGQRLIASSKVMKDHHTLGDYLLIPTSASKKGRLTPLTLYLSQTIDSRSEMEIVVTLANKKEIKFYFEFGIPLLYAKDIMRKQFAVPSDIEYYFVPEGRSPLADMNKCLLDYGILPSSGKKLRTTLIVGPISPPPVVCMPQVGGGNVILLPVVDIKGVQNATKSLAVSKVAPDLVDVAIVGCDESSLTQPASLFKKKPDSKRKSPTCSMFGGMKKGFLSSSNKRKKN